MTNWNYRIVKEESYTIREVFYDGDKIVSWTADEISPSGETIGDLMKSWEFYQQAFKRPVVVVKGDDFIGEEELG